jgi:hypothetical protein
MDKDLKLFWGANLRMGVGGEIGATPTQEKGAKSLVLDTSLSVLGLIVTDPKRRGPSGEATRKCGYADAYCPVATIAPEFAAVTKLKGDHVSQIGGGVQAAFYPKRYVGPFSQSGLSYNCAAGYLRDTEGESGSVYIGVGLTAPLGIRSAADVSSKVLINPKDGQTQWVLSLGMRLNLDGTFLTRSGS